MDRGEWQVVGGSATEDEEDYVPSEAWIDTSIVSADYDKMTPEQQQAERMKLTDVFTTRRWLADAAQDTVQVTVSCVLSRMIRHPQERWSDYELALAAGDFGTPVTLRSSWSGISIANQAPVGEGDAVKYSAAVTIPRDACAVVCMAEKSMWLGMPTGGYRRPITEGIEVIALGQEAPILSHAFFVVGKDYAGPDGDLGTPDDNPADGPGVAIADVKSRLAWAKDYWGHYGIDFQGSGADGAIEVTTIRSWHNNADHHFNLDRSDESRESVRDDVFFETPEGGIIRSDNTYRGGESLDVYVVKAAWVPVWEEVRGFVHAVAELDTIVDDDAGQETYAHEIGHCLGLVDVEHPGFHPLLMYHLGRTGTKLIGAEIVKARKVAKGPWQNNVWQGGQQ